MGKNSVFWKWMISYVAVMLVFLLCNSITYWQGKRILLRNQETENEKIVEQICDNLTNIEETMRACLILCWHRKIPFFSAKILTMEKREVRPGLQSIPDIHCVSY